MSVLTAGRLISIVIVKNVADKAREIPNLVLVDKEEHGGAVAMLPLALHVILPRKLRD